MIGNNYVTMFHIFNLFYRSRSDYFNGKWFLHPFGVQWRLDSHGCWSTCSQFGSRESRICPSVGGGGTELWTTEHWMLLWCGSVYRGDDCLPLGEVLCQLNKSSNDPWWGWILSTDQRNVHVSVWSWVYSNKHFWRQWSIYNWGPLWRPIQLATHYIHMEGFKEHTSILEWMPRRGSNRPHAPWPGNHTGGLQNRWKPLGRSGWERQHSLGSRPHVVWRADTRGSLATLRPRRSGVKSNNSGACDMEWFTENPTGPLNLLMPALKYAKWSFFSFTMRKRIDRYMYYIQVYHL